MTVTLINLPSPFLIKDTIMPPLGLLYLSSYLKKHRVDVEVIDLSGGAKLPKLYSEIIGLSSTTPQFPEAIRVLDTIKGYNDSSTIIIGGPHATCEPEQCFYTGFNGVVIGEGEKAFYKILCFGKSVLPYVNEEPVEDLDVLPFPDRDAIDLKKYSFKIDDESATTMITSRGCNFHCAFCSKTWNGLRFRSAENVLAEVNQIQEKYGINAIMFYDDNFAINYPRLKKICDGLKELEAKWRCLVRVNLVNRETLQMMKDSGCVSILAGIESLDFDILNAVDKRITPEQSYEVTKTAKEIGLNFKALLMLGLPGESRKSVEEMRKYLRDAKPDDFDISIYTPYPKSIIWDYPEMFDIQFKKSGFRWYKGKVGQYTSTVSTSQLRTDEILALRDELETEFKPSNNR